MTRGPADDFERILAFFDGEEAVSGQGDAIDDILDGRPRETGVRSLRDAPAVIAFRRELEDGLVRADTLHQVLGLVLAIIEARLS